MSVNYTKDDENCRQYHHLYTVVYGNKRILRPESMTLTFGRSECADFIISVAEVSRKQCEVICSGGVWKLRNLSKGGTAVVGKSLVKDNDLILKEEHILKIGGVFIQFKFEVESAELPMRIFKIIVLIGDVHCRLSAESDMPNEPFGRFAADGIMPKEPFGKIAPNCMNESVVEIPRCESSQLENVVMAKDAIISNLIAENYHVMQELKELKSALKIALTDKDEAKSKESQMKERLKLMLEKPLLANEIGETIENELLCSVCNEMLLEATTLECSHTFCAHCLAEWKKKSRICPLCRSNMRHECKARVVDSLIEKILVNLPEETQKRRKELTDARKASKKRSRNRSSGRQKRKRLAIIELGDPVSDVHEVVRISVNYSNEANETIEIISSDDDNF